MASEVGHAFVSLVPSARGFSRIARKELRTALAGVEGEVPIKPDVDEAAAAAAGRKVSTIATKAAPDVKVGVDVDRGLVARAFRAAFTSNPALLQAMRTGIPAVLSSPVGLAAVVVAGSFALSFVGALAASLATAGLPAVFLGLGAFLLKDNKKIVAGFENMVDRIKGAFEGVADSLIEPLSDAMGLVGDAAERAAPMVETLMEAFSPAIVPLVEGALGAVENFLSALASDPGALQAMTDALSEMGEHLPRLGTALGEFFTTLANNENVVKNIGPFFSILVGAIGALGAVISFWADGFAFWVSAWHRLQNTVGVVVAAVGTAASAVGDALAAVGRFFGELPGRIGSALSTAWQAVVGFATLIFGWFAALPGRVAGFLAALPGRVASIFRQLFLQTLTQIAFGITTILLITAALPGKLAELFTRAFNAAVRAVRIGVAAVVDFMAKLPGRAATAVSTLWAKIKGAFISAVVGVTSRAEALVRGFIGVIRNLPGQARDEAIKVKDRILGAFRGADRWLVSVGGDILRGLANGVRGAIGAAVEAAKAAAGAVLDGVKGALGIGSPSKVMRDQVGKWIPVGIAEGIRLNSHAAQDALDVLTSRLSRPALSGPGRVDVATAGVPNEFMAEATIDLGEGITKVVNLKLRRKDQNVRRRTLAGTGAAR